MNVLFIETKTIQVWKKKSVHFGHLKVDEKFCKLVPSERAEAKTSQAASIALAGDKIGHKLKSSTPSVRNPRGTDKRDFGGFGTPGATYSSVI